MFGMFLKAATKKQGQAMVESILSLIFILLVFLLLFNLSDNIRVKLLAENAAMKCARARAVGYNDFQLRKIARLTMMPASGRCLIEEDAGTLSYSERLNRMSSYLNSDYETQANRILDFEGWRNGGVQISASSHSDLISAEVTKLKPDNFNFTALTENSKDSDGQVKILGESSCESHYTDYLQ
jgi:hypothetical protein